MRNFASSSILTSTIIRNLVDVYSDYWQWHKRGMEEVSFCLGVVAQCIVTGLLVTRPGFDSRRKLTFSIPLLVFVYIYKVPDDGRSKD